jgi:glycogen operon protein
MSQGMHEGKSSPLGASWDGQGVNFALFSAHAEKVELCLFDENGEHEIARYQLPCTTDEVWHGYLPGCGPGAVYGYRVYGPYRPDQGHRFNHHKLLVDPYARQLLGGLNWSNAILGYDPADPRDEIFDTRDSAADVPKSVVVDEAFDWQDDRPPRVPWSETIIYETHVRGFTRLHPAIDVDRRGSFSALACADVITYLQSLGITSVELLPIHEFVDDKFLVEKKLRNYWGYNTLGYFAPAARYLGSGDRNEFKTMVRELHRAGIEVILDVVYNHTAEGDRSGPTLSFRGIDNASYYRLLEDDPREYINDTGCGNTLNANHPRVLQMIIDSLRYWVDEMHVDGFRFDLAVSLGRESHGFDSHGEFFRRIRQDEVLSRVKLIAEPWDVGPGGYQLGAFPTDWGEWNDRFRDAVRRFWRGDEGQLPGLASALHGSNELFEHNDRRPSASINLVTSHDGFTLADLVSYNERHNEANGEDNNDGHEANFSHNHGVEGFTDDPSIDSLRQRQSRNLLATLMLAQGTPMLLAGDEIGRSQQGNNNAYCQDNELNWLDWSLLERNADLHDLVRRLADLRRHYAVLRYDRFLHDNRIRWLRADGSSMTEADWHDPQRRFLAMLLSITASGPPPQSPREATLLLAFNAGAEPIVFELPETRHGWHCIFSTAIDEPDRSAVTSLSLEARSVQVFELRAGKSP